MSESLVKKLTRRPCITIHEDQSVSNLITLLNEKKVGCIVVISGSSDKLKGIVSERDLIRNYKKINQYKNTKVYEIMTKKIISCTRNTTSKQLMEIMNEFKIRHIPIIEESKLLGIVSIGDVVNRIIANYAFETKYLREYIHS